MIWSFRGPEHTHAHPLPFLITEIHLLGCHSPTPKWPPGLCASFLGLRGPGAGLGDPGEQADACQHAARRPRPVPRGGDPGVTFGPLGGLPALAGRRAVDRLGRRAELGAGVPLGLGGRLPAGATAAVVLGAPDRVQRLGPHGKATGAGMGKSVLRSGHRHESHAEMFARVTAFVAPPHFATYAVKQSRAKSVKVKGGGRARSPTHADLSRGRGHILTLVCWRRMSSGTNALSTFALDVTVKQM